MPLEKSLIYQRLLNQLYLKSRADNNQVADLDTMLNETDFALKAPQIARKSEPFDQILPLAYTMMLSDGEYKQSLLQGLGPDGEQVLLQFFQYFGFE